MANKVTLKVATPAGIYEGAFEENTKVRKMIEVIVKAESLAEGDAFELDLDGKSLALDQELSSLCLDNNTMLDLIATGSGV